MKYYYYKTNDRCKYMNILATSLDNFMSYNPPCKECLIQGMCLTEYEYDIPNEDMYHEITIYLCERMNEFINNNSAFEELND